MESQTSAGLTVGETASVLGIGAGTVKRKWALAKPWLCAELAVDA